MVEQNSQTQMAFVPKKPAISVPPGYRFKPTDEELVVHYLWRKAYNQPLRPNVIEEVQLYKYSPDDLTAYDKERDEWYFFTPRERKYQNGKRPRRAAGNGYWKATGSDKKIKIQEKTVGLKKSLVYHEGKHPQGNKTNWIMHEYVLSDPPPRQRAGIEDMRLDDWVLCRVYKKHKNVSTDGKQDHAIQNAMPTNPMPASTSALPEFSHPMLPQPTSTSGLPVFAHPLLPQTSSTPGASEFPHPMLSQAVSTSGLSEFPQPMLSQAVPTSGLSEFPHPMLSQAMSTSGLSEFPHPMLSQAVSTSGLSDFSHPMFPPRPASTFELPLSPHPTATPLSSVPLPLVSSSPSAPSNLPNFGFEFLEEDGYDLSMDFIFGM